MTVTELEEKFAVPGVMRFKETASGLAYLLVTAPSAQATICMYGAHLTHWKPTGQQLAIFLSERTDIVPGVPIRGGVPIIFPWFGPRHDGKEGPLHGFARLEIWELESAVVVGDEVHLMLTLGANETSRALGFDHFRLTYRVLVGKTLTLELTGKIDRVYRNTTATCTIDDTVAKRKITVAKENSQTTVVWNPWSDGAATIKDLAPDAWRGMLCVETANVGESAVTLAPGASHTLRATYSIEGTR